MHVEGSFSWKSNLMEIISAEERISKSTLNPYLVVKARMVFFGNPVRRGGKKQPQKVYTMMCFSEPLFALFDAGNYHIFEGELSFDWGNTWLKITKLYDDKGNRLLRPTKGEKTNAFDEKLADSVGKNLETYVAEEIEKIQEKNGTLLCDHICEQCLDYDCSDCPLY